MQSGINEKAPLDLKTRTRQFALRIIRVYGAAPKNTLAQVLGKQLLRSGTSVGAHFCEAERGRSSAEFISKLEGGLQELEETIYWMDLMVEAGIFRAGQMKDLISEARELNAILTTCVKNAKRKTGRL